MIFYLLCKNHRTQLSIMSKLIPNILFILTSILHFANSINYRFTGNNVKPSNYFYQLFISNSNVHQVRNLESSDYQSKYNFYVNPSLGSEFNTEMSINPNFFEINQMLPSPPYNLQPYSGKVKSFTFFIVFLEIVKYILLK